MLEHRLDCYWAKIKEDRNSYEHSMRQDTTSAITEWLADLKKENALLTNRVARANNREHISIKNSAFLKMSLVGFIAIVCFWSALFSLDGWGNLVIYGALYTAMSTIEFSEIKMDRSGRISGIISRFCMLFCCYVLVSDSRAQDYFSWISFSVLFCLFLAMESYCTMRWARDVKRSIQLNQESTENKKNITWCVKRLSFNNYIDSLLTPSLN